MSALVLDEIKCHPLHIHTLHASRDVATMRCLDCRQEMTGTYEEIVTWWKWHVSIQESKP